MANWCDLPDISNTTFSLITSVSDNLWSCKFTGVCFLTQEIQKWHQNCPETYCFWAIGKSNQNLPFSVRDAFLLRHSFTEIKHFAKTVYYCWSLVNAGSPRRWSFSQEHDMNHLIDAN